LKAKPHNPEQECDRKPAPPPVHRALKTNGKPLDPVTRKSTEIRFGHDFSRVQVHDNATAAASARSVNAAAYTVGRHVVFGGGHFAPKSSQGRRLLAHELTHVAQQKGYDGEPALSDLKMSPAADKNETQADQWAADSHKGSEPVRPLAATPQVQRFDIGQTLTRFFGGGTFSEQELQDYLRFLDENDRIEDYYDSDNKAREVVVRWKRGDSLYILPVNRKVLLIEEMISGFTGDDDERAILDLLRGATQTELAAIVQRVGQSRLADEFHGSERKQLDRLLGRRSPGEPSGDEESARQEEESETFSGENILALQRSFTSNAESAHRLNCILIIRELAPQLFGADPQVGEDANASLGALRGGDIKMTEFGRVLSELGLVSRQARIRFNNGNGNNEPTAMQGSAWDTIIDMVGTVQGWHVFGLAPFNGYHSVTVLVNNRADGPRVYWADQWRITPSEAYDQPDNFKQTFGSVSGFRRYDKAGLDGFLMHYTRTRWNTVHSADSDCAKRATKRGRDWDRMCRWPATLHIWKFRSRLEQGAH